MSNVTMIYMWYIRILFPSPLLCFKLLIPSVASPRDNDNAEIMPLFMFVALSAFAGKVESKTALAKQPLQNGIGNVHR